jgi:hypothetical protein
LDHDITVEFLLMDTWFRRSNIVITKPLNLTTMDIEDVIFEYATIAASLGIFPLPIGNGTTLALRIVSDKNSWRRRYSHRLPYNIRM